MRVLIDEARILLGAKSDGVTSPGKREREYQRLMKRVQKRYGGGQHPVDQPVDALVNPDKPRAHVDRNRQPPQFTTER